MKHRVPNGALRLDVRLHRIDEIELHAIKHRAPNGALRRRVLLFLRALAKQS